MKKDLGKSYGEAVDVSDKKHYPSTTIETDEYFKIPQSVIEKDIPVKMIVRICRKTDEIDKKGAKTTLQLEFRKIDFGAALDQTIEQDIIDAIEGSKREGAADHEES